MKIDASIQEKINAFAKANKFSKSKLETLVSEILEAVPDNQGQVIIKGGKPAKESTKELRSRFKGEFKNLPVLTSEGVANHFGVSKTDANNCLNYYGNLGLIKKGASIRVTGKRGRSAIIWEAC